MTDARLAAERAARTSYGKLVAILAAGCRDVAAAEDALSSAFAAALSTWPERGVPDNPEGWLVTAARNALKNERRSRQVRTAATDEILRRMEGANAAPGVFPDERLKLLFVCGHPAIDPGMRAPLMLQVVLGLDAASMSAAFLTAPSAMSQRLVRAKARIRDAGLRFAEPEAEELSGRLGDVLDAIYAAYGMGWDAVPGADDSRTDLAWEAVELARMVAGLLPGEPEPRGLLALMLYCDARRDARRDADGQFVPLHRQDARLWRRDLIVEAEALLTEAARASRFGRYQCEAAIQSVHVQRSVTGRTHTAALRTLYDWLLQVAPSVGVMVSRAAMLLDAGDIGAARAALDAVPHDRRESYQPFWVVLAALSKREGDAAAAAEALSRAIGLTTDPGVRAFLMRTGAEGESVLRPA